jgi:hypothetical protein
MTLVYSCSITNDFGKEEGSKKEITVATDDTLKKVDPLEEPVKSNTHAANL